MGAGGTAHDEGDGTHRKPPWRESPGVSAFQDKAGARPTGDGPARGVDAANGGEKGGDHCWLGGGGRGRGRSCWNPRSWGRPAEEARPQGRRVRAAGGKDPGFPDNLRGSLAGLGRGRTLEGHRGVGRQRRTPAPCWESVACPQDSLSPVPMSRFLKSALEDDTWGTSVQKRSARASGSPGPCSVEGRGAGFLAPRPHLPRGLKYPAPGDPIPAVGAGRPRRGQCTSCNTTHGRLLRARPFPGAAADTPGPSPSAEPPALSLALPQP